MTPLVVDATVVSRWFLPEPDGEAARRLLDRRRPLVAPDVLFPELIRIVQRQVRHGRLRAAQGRRLVSDLTRIPVDTVPCRELAEDAWALSAPGRPVLDSVYLALAVRLQTCLLTADTRIVDGVAAFPRLARHVRHVAEWSGDADLS